MNNEKIIKSEHEKEIALIFRKLTASGAINGDKAAEIIMRDYPQYFHQPTEDELKKTFNAAMNDEIRIRAQPTNNMQIFRFQPNFPETGTP
jgi:hypothetical protein